MKLVRATLQIYQDAALAAGRAFLRSAWAFGLLLLFFPILWFAAVLLAPLGMIGGILVAVLNAACAGTYLATLQDALALRRALGFASLRANFSRYAGDVLSVLFPIWIVGLLLGLLELPLVPLLFSIVVAVGFNPAPEMIGRVRSRGLELLGDALTFMGGNWPEWLLPQLVVLGVGAWVLPRSLVQLAGLFGPQFGFVQAGSLVLGGGSLLGWLGGLVTVAFVHAFMLFRGALYERLASGGRRGRAWQAQFR